MHTLIIFIVEAMYEAFLYQFMKTMHALVHHHFIVEEMYVKGVSVAFTDHKKILHACMHTFYRIHKNNSCVATPLLHC